MGEIINFESWKNRTEKPKKPVPFTSREMSMLLETVGSLDNIFTINILDSNGKTYDIHTVLIDSDNNIITLVKEEQNV